MTLAPLHRDIARHHFCEPDVTHMVCCDADQALCGKWVRGHQWVPPGTGIPCPLCSEATGCFLCGPEGPWCR